MISEHDYPRKRIQWLIPSQSLKTKQCYHYPVTTLFLKLGISNFYDAISHVQKIPYGRNSLRDNYLLVLKENKGTCSTKHALIKALALENSINIDLFIGIFLMTATNTPIIRHVLNKHNLHAVPEAHCYLRYKSDDFDITFPDTIKNPNHLNLIEKRCINPEQIGQDKIDFHQAFIQHWISKSKISISLESLWKIREDCIKMLEKSPEKVLS